MENKLNIRQVIVECGYKLLFIHNVESITIAQLEKLLQHSRGFIYYYFSSKEKLFNAAIDDFFFPVIDDFEVSKIKNNLLSSYETPLERLLNSIQLYDSSVNPVKAVLNIIVQADKFYPDFASKIMLKLQSEKEQILASNIVSKSFLDFFYAYKLGAFISSFYDPSFVDNVIIHKVDNKVEVVHDTFNNYFDV